MINNILCQYLHKIAGVREFIDICNVYRAAAAAPDDVNVVRVEQQSSNFPFGRQRVDLGAERQFVFAGYLHQTAVAPIGAALCTDGAVAPGLPIGPHNHRTAVAVVQRVGFQRGIGAKKGFLSVWHIGLFALKPATHPNFAAAALAAHVNQRVVCHRHAIAQHVDRAAFGPGCIAPRQHLGVAIHAGITGGTQHHFAALHVGGNGLNQATVFERAGKNADRVAFERTQVDSLVGRGLHFERDAFQPAPGDFNLLAGHQRDAAVFRLNHGGFGQIDRGSNQHYIATPGDDVAFYREGASVVAQLAATKAQAAGQGVGIFHADGRGGETRCVDQRARAYRNAALVDQHHPAIAGQSAKQLRGCVGHHPVDRHAGRVGLVNLGGGPRANREAVPVGGRMRRARAIGGSNGEFASLAVVGRGGAVDGYTALGQGLGMGIGKITCKATEPDGDRQRHNRQTRRPLQLRKGVFEGVGPVAGTGTAALAPAGFDFSHGNHGTQGLVPDGTVNVIQ